MEPLRPVIAGNEAFVTSRKGAPKLFLPNPFPLSLAFFAFSLLMFGFLLVCLKDLLLTYQLQHHGGRVNGEVVATKRYNVKNGYRYEVTYRYTVDGIERTRTDRELFPHEGEGLRPETMVPLVYNVKNPSLARLGTPSRFWGPSQSAQWFLLLFVVLGLGVGGYFFSEAAREVAVHRKLCREGQIASAEVISWERSERAKKQLRTELVYRLPLADGSTIGRAIYSSRDEGAVRRARAGDKVPVLMIDCDLHRPV